MNQAPEIDVDLYDERHLADPWQLLDDIRRAGPLVWNAQAFWMTGHDKVCRQILTQPDRLGQEGLISSLFGPEAMISIDNRALHNALRGVWVNAFGANGVAALEPVIRQVVDGLLDDVLATLRLDGRADLMPLLCRPLPAHVIAHMMGVQPDMIAAVIAWSDHMAEATAGGFPIDYAHDPHWLASERAKAELGAFILDQIGYRRRHPGGDLISAIVGAEIAGQLSDEALMVNIRQLLFAGNETTSKWLGHIVVALGEHAELRTALRRDRGRIAAANEEILRWQGITQVLPRGVGPQGATIEGVALPPGAEVMLLIGAAGRDPARWERPDELDIEREAKPHLAFGYGLHTCLGATLARMEARVVAEALLDRLPDYALAAPVTYGNFSLRGPTSVVVAAA